MEFLLKTESGSEGDAFVMPSALLKNISELGRKLHASPGDIGKIAAETYVGSLVLDQIVAGGLVDGEENLEYLRSPAQRAGA